MTETVAPTAADSAPTDVPTFRHFIAGEWCESTSGATFESRNPADTRDIIGRFQQGTAADVGMAIKAAEAAGPMWRRTPAPRRGEILYAFAQHAGLDLHVEQRYGRSPHHVVEAVFKGLARALRAAVELDPRVADVPSVKGTL